MYTITYQTKQNDQYYTNKKFAESFSEAQEIADQMVSWAGFEWYEVIDSEGEVVLFFEKEEPTVLPIHLPLEVIQYYKQMALQVGPSFSVEKYIESTLCGIYEQWKRACDPNFLKP